MRWIATAVLCFVLALRAGTCLSQALENPVLGEAEALVREGKAEHAWQLLSRLESQYAGQPDFDHLLGIAALESGRPNRATFILERVITVNPGHLAARLEMARAYFELRDFERAEREFNFLLRSSPPAETRTLVQSYLARMRDPGQPRDSGFSGYAEVMLGRDTNVSAAAAQSSVFIPGLGTEFFPDPLFQRRADDFTALGAGLEYAQTLHPGLAVFGGADLRQRWHSDVDAFDSRVVDLHAALIHRLDERDRMQYSVRHNHYELDNTRYRGMQSLSVQWSRGLSARTRIALGAQGYRIRYVAEDTQASSSDLFAAAAGVTHLLQESTRTVGALGVQVARDNAVAGRSGGDRHILGLNVALQRNLSERVEGFVRYSLLRSRYESENLDFGDTRRDRQQDAAIGLAWEVAENWFVRPQISRTKNHSNLPLSDYSRTELSIALRRVWD